MNTKHLLINVVLLVALLLASCSSDEVRVGELRTESKSIELGDAKAVRVEVEAGLHTIEATGLTRHGNVYTNDVIGESEVILQINLEAGIGQINLEVEEGL